MNKRTTLGFESQTVKNLLAASKRRLAQASLENAALDAEWIIAHVLRVNRLRLPLVFDREIIDAESKVIFELIERRISREPLQYVLGNVTFADLDLKVDSRALIPRPETEQLFSLI